MEGHFTNARRIDYGIDVKGSDFAIEGLGDLKGVTHAEVKHPVGSAIETEDNLNPNIWRQGKRIGKKSRWQKLFWSNITRTSEVPNIKLDAYLPKSFNNMVTIIDFYDVPNFEKETIKSAIFFGAKNDTGIINLSNRTNI